MQKTFKLPVLPYVKKYVEKQFFNGQAAPYKIEEDTLIGKNFMSVIIDKRHRDIMDKHHDLTAEIHITLSDAMAKRSPRLSNLMCVNYFLVEDFKDALTTWINAAGHYHIRPFVACKGFLEYYGIDENEYSLDAAYRLWQREKNGEYKKKKAGSVTK